MPAAYDLLMQTELFLSWAVAKRTVQEGNYRFGMITSNAYGHADNSKVDLK